MNSACNFGRARRTLFWCASVKARKHLWRHCASVGLWCAILPAIRDAKAACVSLWARPHKWKKFCARFAPHAWTPCIPSVGRKRDEDALAAKSPTQAKLWTDHPPGFLPVCANFRGVPPLPPPFFYFSQKILFKSTKFLKKQSNLHYS